MNKNCYICRESKSVSLFNKKGDGFHSYCKPCAAKANKRRRVGMRKSCSVCGDVGYVERGMCPMHYERWHKTGDPGPPNRLRGVQKTCDVEGCFGAHYARGWCALHYRRVRRDGSPGSVLPWTPRRECLVRRCERKHKARGLCEMHYHRWYNTGKIGPARVRSRRGCSYKPCEARHYRYGFCKTHYKRPYCRAA